MPYTIKNPFTKKRDRTADDSQYNKYRRTSVKTYDTTRWKRVRRNFLYKNPLCEECLKVGIIKAAELVHHRIPIKNGGAEYDYSNLEAICHECHNRIHRQMKKEKVEEIEK